MAESLWREEGLLREKYLTEEKSINEVAEELGTSYATIYRWMDKFGIEKRTPTQDMDGAWRDEEVLRELYVGQKLTIPEVAGELGCGKTTVHRWLKRHGIDRRNSGGRREWAWFGTDNWGYERWNEAISGETVRVHRLVAVAEYGFDVVKNMAVHHKNGVKWDNRPGNLELMTHSDHSKMHIERRIRANSGDFKA